MFSNEHESLRGGIVCGGGRYGPANGQGRRDDGEVHLDLKGLRGDRHLAVLKGVLSEVK